MDWEDGFFELEEEPAEARRDAKIDEAKDAIRKLFVENPGRVFYVRQVEVRLEKHFYHWITGFALRELIDEGYLQAEMVQAGGTANVSARFVFRPAHRFRRRQIKRACRIIAAYSEPRVARACGEQAQTLFLLSLLKVGFEFRGENTREFGGRLWTETEHDLDFVLAKDGVMYGFEVKNRLEYIGKAELEVKLRMCEFLGLQPVFIMRAAAKS